MIASLQDNMKMGRDLQGLFKLQSLNTMAHLAKINFQVSVSSSSRMEIDLKVILKMVCIMVQESIKQRG